MRSKRNTVDWANIASFYAGRPVTVGPGDTGGAWGRTSGVQGPGEIFLSPQIQKVLQDFQGFTKDPIRGPNSVLGPATLIHEAIHNRKFPGFDQWGNKVGPGSGFMPSDNEIQANALGPELVADLLQRFFGIPMGSDLSNRYMKAARGLSQYRAAYAHGGIR